MGLRHTFSLGIVGCYFCWISVRLGSSKHISNSWESNVIKLSFPYYLVGHHPKVTIKLKNNKAKNIQIKILSTGELNRSIRPGVGSARRGSLEGFQSCLAKLMNMLWSLIRVKVHRPIYCPFRSRAYIGIDVTGCD